GVEMRKNAHATKERIRSLSDCIKEVKVINFEMMAQNVEVEEKIKIGIGMASLGLMKEVMDDISRGKVLRWLELVNYLLIRKEKEKKEIIKLKEKEKDYRIMHLEREIKFLKKRNIRHAYKKDEYRGYSGKGFGFNKPKVVKCFICGEECHIATICPKKVNKGNKDVYLSVSCNDTKKFKKNISNITKGYLLNKY
ncbi:hypothetical protein COBT_002850, partial [Conglomerata obtusa]